MVAPLSPLHIKVCSVVMVKGRSIRLSLLNLPISCCGHIVQDIPPLPPNALAGRWETLAGCQELLWLIRRHYLVSL